MAQNFANPGQTPAYGAQAPAPAAVNPFDPLAPPPADPFATAPPVTPTVASAPGAVAFGSTPPVPQQQPLQQQQQQPVQQQYGQPPTPTAGSQYAGMVPPQQQQVPPQQPAPQQQAIVPAAQQSNQWGVAAPVPTSPASFDPFAAAPAPPAPAPAPPAPAPAPPAQVPVDPWANQQGQAAAQQPQPAASQQQLVVSPWEQQAQQPPPQYQVPPTPSATDPRNAPISEVDAAIPSSGVSAVSEPELPQTLNRNTAQQQVTPYSGNANGNDNGNGNSLHLENSPENKYANMLARQAPPGASPLPRAELVRKSGYVLARISFRTIIMKSWKQSYWVQYGPHTMLWFRNQEDFKDWLNNPYHSQAQRNYLIKLAVNFVHDLYRPNVRGYQVTQSTTKSYGREMMKQFKLERWMDYGPTIAAAFASQDAKEVDVLRETIVQCMRNTPTDHGIRHTGAVRQDYQEQPNGGESYQNYTYDSFGEGAKQQKGERDDRSYASDPPSQNRPAGAAEYATQTSAPPAPVADLLGGDLPPAPVASPAMSAPPAYQQPPAVTPAGVPQQQQAAPVGYQQPQQQAPAQQQQYAGYQQTPPQQGHPQYQQQQQY
mmetsp:Transcript_5428/g.8241  ORF Transcript_5428/g.8241 Transcript_5428/m.8241 type:complete len:599 (+) Transcript_5428:228-2024(+)